MADPDIDVFMLDAGPVDQLAIGGVAAFEQFDVYVVGLADGRVRAVDGIVRANRCAVRWLPDDRRALSLNPLRRPGAFADRCSDVVWAITGDAVSGTSDPLRTFQVTSRRDEAGVEHVQAEVIGRATPARSAGERGGGYRRTLHRCSVAGIVWHAIPPFTIVSRASAPGEGADG